MEKMMDSEKIDSFIERELEVIRFWQENKIFEKSVESRPKSRNYVFYDGPPFATGLPHYGHLLGSTLKDVIPRYFTMKGFRVERVWGWDCHGLPIENIVEKELQIQGGKKGIEAFGVKNFCAACRATVLRFDAEWKKFITRIGRFVDMEHSYKTMDNTFIESVWWGFKKLWEKGLIYEGRRVILYCPRCATPLSDFEIAMDKSYRDVEDDSVYVKFKIQSDNLRKNFQDEYLLAWTTTPWTLPGNVALAVDRNSDYVRVRVMDEVLILAKSRIDSVITGPYETLGEMKGYELEGMGYMPLYKFLPIGDKNAYFVTSADFVSMEEGTGIVHTAVMYGEDDYRLGMQIGLPAVPMLSDEGRFLDFAEFLSGKFFKEADKEIIEDLKSRGLIYREERVVHSYPFCYRCETPLFYNAVPAWFINIQKVKKDLIVANESISWHPDHFKHGQFKDILENSPDWNISRSRYWGNPMPVWVCEKCGEKKIIGSVGELVENALEDQKSEIIDTGFDLHRPYIDEIKFNCECGGIMNRVPDVFDCWVESGSMSFAAKHYPFENKEWFEQNYPADFIGEYVSQVRAWFNVLHRISVALFGKPSFKNVSVTGTYLGTDGKKLSKSRKNFPDPTAVINRYGVDALRFYMMSSAVMKAEDVVFSESGVREARNQFINPFYNCYNFLRLYSDKKFDENYPKENKDLLDRWIEVRTHEMIKDVTSLMDNYDLVNSCRVLRTYVDDLSTWYLRRNRGAIKGDQSESLTVLGASLIRFSKMTASITPFISEYIYRNLTREDSVHLSFLPEFEFKTIQEGKDIVEKMYFMRKITEAGHAQRKVQGIKVRQPLQKVTIRTPLERLPDEFIRLFLDEINVKNIEWQKVESLRESEVTLDIVITPQLKAEGEARELVRAVQDLRKEKQASVRDRIVIYAPSWPREFEDYIKNETLADNLRKAPNLSVEILR